jgi:hypothetical protein
MTLAQPQADTDLVEQRHLWRIRNRGVLGKIADKFGLSYSFVRRVFLGELTSGERRVEKEFKKLGCPGF